MIKPYLYIDTRYFSSGFKSFPFHVEYSYLGEPKFTLEMRRHATFLDSHTGNVLKDITLFDVWDLLDTYYHVIPYNCKHAFSDVSVCANKGFEKYTDWQFITQSSGRSLAADIKRRTNNTPFALVSNFISRGLKTYIVNERKWRFTLGILSPYNSFYLNPEAYQQLLHFYANVNDTELKRKVFNSDED